MRYVGPAMRCNCIRTNYRVNGFFEGNEPYATLSKFRASPTLGVLFGSYYAVEMLTDKATYEVALP